MRIVIIGSSAAGISAVETIRNFDKTSPITVITEEKFPSYFRCLIPKLISKEMEPSRLVYKSGGFYKRNQVSLLTGKRAVHVFPEERRVILDDDREVIYDRLLIATGANYVPLGIDNENLYGVFPLRTYEHAEFISELADKAKNSVVIGAGLVGLNAAMALRKRGLKVTVVESAPHLLINQLDQRAANIVQQELSAQDVNFVFNSTPVAFGKSKEGALCSVCLDNGGELPAPLAVVGVGVRPNKNLIKKANGKTGVGIVVDSFLRTSFEHIYSAGDCIELRDPLSGDVFSSGLWPHAVVQGRIAAMNMLGRNKPYTPFVLKMNSVQFGRVPVISMGCIKEDVCDDFLIYENIKEKIYRRLFLKHNKLIGCILVGDLNGAGIYSLLIKKQLPILWDKNRLIRGDINFFHLSIKGGLKDKGGL